MSVLSKPIDMEAGVVICNECGRTVTSRHWYRSGQPRCWKRRWTRARLWRVMTLIEAGWSDARIARALDTTADSVCLARKRNGIPSRTVTLFSARAVADRLGLGCAKAMTRWIEAGWLRGTPGPRRGPHPQWQVHPDELERFLADPAHWHRWDPARIPDETLRRRCARMRADIRFLTVGAAAVRAGVTTNAVHQWIAKGWLSAVRHGNHLIRETDLDAFLAIWTYGEAPGWGMAA